MKTTKKIEMELKRGRLSTLKMRNINLKDLDQAYIGMMATELVEGIDEVGACCFGTLIFVPRINPYRVLRHIV